MSKFWLGLAIGVIYAAADAFLMWCLLKKAQENRERASRVVLVGMVARYLLTIAVLAVALLIPQIDAVGVVAALILQKIILVIHSLV